MIDKPGKRIAAGFLKLFGGFAIALLLLTQFLDDAAERDGIAPAVETGQQQD